MVACQKRRSPKGPTRLHLTAAPSGSHQPTRPWAISSTQPVGIRPRARRTKGQSHRPPSTRTGWDVHAATERSNRTPPPPSVKAPLEHRQQAGAERVLQQGGVTTDLLLDACVIGRGPRLKPPGQRVLAERYGTSRETTRQGVPRRSAPLKSRLHVRG